MTGRQNPTHEIRNQIRNKYENQNLKITNAESGFDVFYFFFDSCFEFRLLDFEVVFPRPAALSRCGIEPKSRTAAPYRPGSGGEPTRRIFRHAVCSWT